MTTWTKDLTQNAPPSVTIYHSPFLTAAINIIAGTWEISLLRKDKNAPTLEEAVSAVATLPHPDTPYRISLSHNAFGHPVVHFVAPLPRPSRLRPEIFDRAQ